MLTSQFLGLYNHSHLVRMHIHNAWLLHHTNVDIILPEMFFETQDHLFLFCRTMQISLHDIKIILLILNSKFTWVFLHSSGPSCMYVYAGTHSNKTFINRNIPFLTIVYIDMVTWLTKQDKRLPDNSSVCYCLGIASLYNRICKYIVGK